MAHVVAVLNPKGGCGKTTLSIHLARALQLTGREVLLVDSDPQGSSRDWKHTASQSDGPTMFQVIGMDRPSLDMDLPAVSRSFDMVIIDGAARLQDMTAAALRAADTVLIPVQTSVMDIGPALDIASLIQARQKATGGLPRAAFVVSRVPPNTRLAADIDQALADHQLPVLAARTTNRVAYMESINCGSTVLDYAKGSPGAAEILAMGNELLEFARLLTTEKTG